MTGFGRDFTEDDAQRFADGTHDGLHHLLGSHPGPERVTFRVWAPNARLVEVVGEFNHWQARNPDRLTLGPGGVWSGEIEAEAGQLYKYRIHPAEGRTIDKADPFAFAFEVPPGTASLINKLDYSWGDEGWMSSRRARLAPDAPVSIYELHLGSWARSIGYRNVADRLVDHVTTSGFTHVELLPVTEHPFYGSWGYQTTGYFAPTARYGPPGDFMALIDVLHRAGVGVILDWVPSHFPDDAHGLAVFDGTYLYEHPDPRMGKHPDWDSHVFDYDRGEVRSFLLSSAHFWADTYHIDGLRVDAVASMLYRDYSRPEGAWIPNIHGGNENLAAIGFLRELNRSLHDRHPDVATFAEESTAWPGVTARAGGESLEFDYKWDMGWTHDTLAFVRRDPADRGGHHQDLTFRSVYQDSENYVLPLSHDEVVHGKGSLRGAMPGDEWHALATLRLLLGYQWAAPGKKLLFMGAEFGVAEEWDHDSALDWRELSDGPGARVHAYVSKLNGLYREYPALHAGDCLNSGFRWVVADDTDNGVFAFLRQFDEHPPVLVAANFGPKRCANYRIGVPVAGPWTVLIDSNAEAFGGTEAATFDAVTTGEPSHGFDQSLVVALAPLALVMLAPEPEASTA